MRREVVIIGILAAVLVGGLVCSTVFIAYTDRAFICENTGSRKGCREWFFGAQTRNWYNMSELEKFMQATHRDLMVHRWTSYMGTGHSLIPGLRNFGHGRPESILILPPASLDEHVASLSEDGKLELYRLFASADDDAIRKRINVIVDGAMDGIEHETDDKP
jgi:hypothetical protein